MGKQGMLFVAIGVLLGATVTLGAWLVHEVRRPDSIAYGQASGATAMGSEHIVMATGQIAGRGNASVLWIYNTKLDKLGAYLMNNNNLEVVAIRDMTFDWQAPHYSIKGGNQNPTVPEMKRAVGKLKKDPEGG